jgi:hypothetical protein
VGSGFLEVEDGVGLAPQFVEVFDGGEGEVVVPAWGGGYLTLLEMAWRAGSLKVSLTCRSTWMVSLRRSVVLESLR